MSRKSRFLRPLRRHFESLESRQLLAADGASLAPDSFTVPENAEQQILDVLANDEFDPDYAGNRELTAVSTGSQGGRLRISEDRKQILYTPPADVHGEESFTYFVDGDHSATVSVRLVPMLLDDVYEIVPDGETRQFELLSNDPFLDDYEGPRQITILSETSLGGVVNIADDARSVHYELPDGDFGKDTFIYIVDDRFAARVTVDIMSPVEFDRGELLQNSQPVEFNVLQNDPFWAEYGGARKITHVFTTRGDSDAQIVSDGDAIAYQPAAGFHGYETITYVVDSQFESQLQLRVHRPTRDDFATVDRDSTNFFIDVTSNDRYRDSNYIERDVVDRVTEVGETEKGGTVTISSDGRGVLYSPPEGFTGTDTFEYIADDKYPATVRVSISEPVRDDFVQVYTDTTGNRLDVLNNDFFGDGYQGARKITAVSETVNGGLVSIAADEASLVYTPAADQVNRSDSFRYVVDGEFEATVSVYVARIANDDYFLFGQPNEVRLDVFQNDHFSDNYNGEGLITSVTEPAQGGTVEIIDGGRALWYQPGSDRDSFSYTVDGKHEARVTIDYPNRLARDVKTVDQNSGAATIDVLTNDFKSAYIDRRWGPYTGPRIITAVGETEHGGVVEISADGKQVVYTPAEDFHGNDQFSYVVDGFLEASVTVNVIRHVRDDQFYVAPDAVAESLAVLVNDLFSATYEGAGVITDVTPGSAGGVTAVSEDGRHLVYTPPVGFAGEETVTYTVDGALKAEARVTVQSADERFQQFGTLEQFKEYLIEDALRRYDPFFGAPGGSFPELGDGGDASVGAPTAPFSDRVHSDTNVQVAGVDEADYMETDGDYLYSLNHGSLVITKAWPADELQVVSQTSLRGSAVGQYLFGDRLAVVSREYEFIPWEDFAAVPPGPGDVPPGLDGGFAGDSVIYPPYPQDVTTFLTVFDVSDRTAPTVVQQTEVEGDYVESRRLGDHVFLVLDSGQLALPIPQQVCENGECQFESKDAYLERVQNDFESLLEQVLPQYTSLGPDGTIARSGALIQPEDIFQPTGLGSQSLISVVSVDLVNTEPGLAGTSGILTTGAANIYGSAEFLYVLEDRQSWGTETGATVEIIKFGWDGDTGSVMPVATGSVPGRMVDQFSVDEHDGHLRIATTVSNSYSGNFTGRSENLLFVLDDDEGVLEFTGAIKNLALDESIRSVRFFDERAFVVTFQNVDPLIGVDLSDPYEPQVVGHLTLPGYSEHMQFIGPDRLLTVGHNTPTGFHGPAMVSLFNVSETADPVLVDQFTLPRFSHSEANVDHHAFNWFAHQNVLAVPAARVFLQRFDRDNDGYRESREYVAEHELYSFRIDTELASRNADGIRLLGTVSHDSPVRRSVFIEDKVYSIAEKSIKSASIAEPTATIDEVIVGPSEGEPFGEANGANQAAIDQFFVMARADMAERMQKDVGAVMAVASEVESNGEYHIVVRAADRQFAYRTHGSNIALSDDEYSFVPRAPLTWQNPVDPNDISGDGAVVPLDVVLMVNDLNRNGARSLPTETVVRQIDADHYYLDSTGDGFLSSFDVLQVINFLNRETRVGEGEAAAGAYALHVAERAAVEAEQPESATSIDLALDWNADAVPVVDPTGATAAVEQSAGLDEYAASLDRVFWDEELRFTD